MNQIHASGPAADGGRSLRAIFGVLIAVMMVAGFMFRADRAEARTNACNGLTILIVHADSAPARLQTELLAQSGVTTVDLFNGNAGTPSLAAMSGYDMVVTISDATWQNAATLGDRLANYIDQRGTVVPLNFSFYNPGNHDIEGRFKTGGYSPLVFGSALDFSDSTLGAYNVNHPLMRGVSALGAFYRQDMTLASGATQVAAWSDSSPLIAYKGRVVGINFHPQEGEPATWTGDFAKVIANAGNWRSVGCPTNTTLNIDKTAQKVRASGGVSPNHSGRRVQVTLQRKQGGSFKNLATKNPRLNSNSKYATSFDRPNSGDCRIKARFGGHDSHNPVHLPSDATKTFNC